MATSESVAEPLIELGQSQGFPATVSALLLEATRPGIDMNMRLLKFLEAQRQATGRMDPFAEEYAEIVAKIAESFQSIGAPHEAASLYASLSKTYLEELETSKGTLSEDEQDSMMKRALIASVGMAQCTGEIRDPEEAIEKADQLMKSVTAAQDIAVSRSRELKRLLDPGAVPDVLDTLQGKYGPIVVESDLQAAWGSFRDQAFAVREIVTGIFLHVEDFPTVSVLKRETLDLMLRSGAPLSQVLLGANTVAGVALRISLLEQPLKSYGLSPEEEQQTRKEQRDRAYDIYRTIEFSVQTQPERTSELNQALALGLYGQGVVESYRGNWTAAWEKMQESWLAAQGSELEGFFEEIQPEMDKLNALRYKGLSINDLEAGEFPSLNALDFKLAPENWFQPYPTPHIDALHGR